MKRRLLAISLTILGACFASDNAALKQAERKRTFPSSFASYESAETYVQSFHVGGRIENVQIGIASYMLIFEHGSGVPVIRIGVYRRVGERMYLVSTPEFGHGELLITEVSGGMIWVRGQYSNQRWVIFDPSRKSR